MLEFFLLKSFRVDTQMDVLRKTIFENARLPFNRKPLFFKSFSKSGLYRISDISDYQNKTVLDNITIYNKLQNKRNCISVRPQSQKTLHTCTNKRKCKLIIDNNLLFVIVKIKVFTIDMLN